MCVEVGLHRSYSTVRRLDGLFYGHSCEFSGLRSVSLNRGTTGTRRPSTIFENAYLIQDMIPPGLVVLELGSGTDDILASHTAAEMSLYFGILNHIHMTALAWGKLISQ